MRWPPGRRRRWARAYHWCLSLVILAVLAGRPSGAAPVSSDAQPAAADNAPLPTPPPAAPNPRRGSIHVDVPWVWNWRNGLGLVAVAVNAFTGAATGQSGSQILVPIAVLAAGMTVQDSAAFAAAVSAFGALPSLADALTAKHPIHGAERPCIDYPALALGMPALLVGVKVGTIVNRAFPAYLLTLLLILLYGWGAIDLSLSYARLLRRERERDALLKRLERRLDRAAALEQAVISGDGAAEVMTDAELWAEDAEGELAALPPAAALGRLAQAPLLVPADKALHAERLALQRDLARLQELSAEIMRREARGVHQGALDRTLDADLLAAFRAQERARLASAQAEGGSPTATTAAAGAAAPAARARGDSFYSSPGGGENGGSTTAASSAPMPLDALARQLLATAHEHERGARIRCVQESALADARYRMHAASVAAESSGRRGSTVAASSAQHRLASLRSAVSVSAAASGPRSSPSSSSSSLGGPAGAWVPSFLRDRAGGGGAGGGSLSQARRGPSSAVSGGSPGGSVLATAGSGPARPSLDGGSGALPPLALGRGGNASSAGRIPLVRSASDLLALSSPWLTAQQERKRRRLQEEEEEGKDDGGGNARPAFKTKESAPSSEADVERGSAADQNANNDDDKGCWVVDEAEEQEAQPGKARGRRRKSSSSSSSHLAAFIARRRDGFARWWHVLPKFEAGIILFSFCAFLAFTLGPELVYHEHPCSAAAVGARAVFAGLMIVTTIGVVAVVLRRHRREEVAAVAAATPAADKAAGAGAAEAEEEKTPLLIAHGRHEGGLDVSPLLAALVPPCAVSVGMFGSSVGASGSVIVQPIGLRMGVHPQIVSATSKILLFVSTAASSLSLTLAGRMNGSYALAYGLVTMALTPPGQWTADALVKKHGRPSLIVLVNILRYVLGVALLVGVVLVPAVDDVLKGSPDGRFVSPC